MDMEGFVRKMLKQENERKVKNKLINRIREFKEIDKEKAAKLASAVIEEVKNTFKINEEDKELKELVEYPKANVTMGEMGVGSRGKGDFFVHRKIAEISLSKGKTVVDPTSQDDGGVVKTESKFGNIYVTTAIDGIHSRLSEYPFLGGFHVTRAALRDVYVMGAKPIAIISDLHLADDGDVGKLFDFTAGVSAVSELTGVPITAGSTLRVGGDMVLGDRLVSAVGAVGISNIAPTARKKAEVGDKILMTEGSGGGTITTTAIYHGFFDVIYETLNIDFMKACEAIINAGLLNEIHAMTDITNGGLRGDAHEISSTTGLGFVFNKEKIFDLINPRVLEMLNKLDIDPLGVSIDSLMVIAPKDVCEEIKDVVSKVGVKIDYVGYVDDSGVPKLKSKNEEKILKPLFREAAYTKIKKVVGEKTPEDFEEMKEKVKNAALKAIKKKNKIVEMIRKKEHGR